MFAQADWAPTQSPEATSRVNGFINRAYNQLALEAPFLFFESKVHLATEPDVESLGGLTGVPDRIQLSGTNTLPLSPTSRDPWTWEATFTHAQATASPTKLNVWKYDRSWDGRMIEITAHDGTLIRNQIRSVWNNSGTYHMTLVRPWDTDTFGDGLSPDDDGIKGFKYRIFTDAYSLPDDLIQLNSARLRDNTNNYPLEVVGQQEAEALQLDGPPSQITSGIPRVIFRRQHVHMQGPSVAPVASAALTNKNLETVSISREGSTAQNKPEGRSTYDNNYIQIDTRGDEPTSTPLESNPSTTSVDVSWLGPEPVGTFEYKVTYTWGKRDVEFELPGLGHWEGFGRPLDITEATTFPSNPATSSVASGDSSSRNRFRTPRFESPPSSASNAMTNVKVGDDFSAIKLSLPNITYALGYMIKSTGVSRQSLDQSGIYIRIYRRRVDVNLADYDRLPNAVDGLQHAQLDSADSFYLLSEFRADSSNKSVWYDNGEFLPDYSRRLRDIHGYQTMQFYPKPDRRYAIDIRAVTRPTKLEDDRDAPLVHAEAVNVLIEKAMVYLYENMGQTGRSEYSAARYTELLLTLSKRYGDLRPPSVPVLRSMTRATGVRTNRRWNRRLSTDDLGGVVE